MAAQRSSIKARNLATVIAPVYHFSNISINLKPSQFDRKVKTCYNVKASFQKSVKENKEVETAVYTYSIPKRSEFQSVSVKKSIIISLTC